MTKQRKQGSFNKRRWFIQLTAVVGLVGGLLAIMNEIKPYFEAKPPRRVLQNTEIVFDRSELMNRRLQDGTPKLEVARKAVDLVLRNETVGDNLALRAFGGACADESTQPALPFDLDNAARVREKIQNLKADGRATLIAAIRAAIADFDDEARFGGVNKRIIVITGNLDACGKSILEIVQQLNRLSKESQPGGSIVLDFDFIGIGLDSVAKQEFDGYAERTGGAAHFVDDPRELESLVEIVEVARVTRSAKAVSELLDASILRLKPVIEELLKKDYVAAERDLQQARDEFARSELPFQDLIKRQNSEQLSPQLSAQYRRIYQAANRSRELQRQVLSLTEDILSQTKAWDERALQASKDKYESTHVAYNQSRDELLALVEQLQVIARSH
jgi:von Willebrand factor type A domain